MDHLLEPLCDAFGSILPIEEAPLGRLWAGQLAADKPCRDTQHVWTVEAAQRYMTDTPLPGAAAEPDEEIAALDEEVHENGEMPTDTIPY